MDTGWTNEPPQAPTGGFAGFLGRMRGTPEDRPAPLARAYYAPDPAEEKRDGDEVAANLLARGYGPGQLSDLAMRHRDAVTAAQAEREKIEKGEKVTARVRGMLERGQIGALEASAMMDGDFGDVRRAEQLERRAESLKRQLADAQALIAPAAQRAPDPIEEAGRRASRLLAEVNRAQLAEARDRRPAPRPFAGRGAAIRSEHCFWCTKEGLDDFTSYLLHSDPEFNLPVTTAEQAAQAEQAEQAELLQHQAERRQADLELFGRQVGIPYRPARSDAEQAEVDRLVALGYSRAGAEHAARPYDAGMAVR